MRSTIFVIIALTLLSSCSLFKGKKKEGNAIARAYDTYLYSDELKGLIPAGTAPKDSTEITRTYINNWIRQELLLHQAEDNLGDDKMDFEKQVEQYRNSLIIFKYESELVRQKLDTSVSMSEIETYYKENQGNFQLHENILRSIYVSLNKNSASAPRLRQLIRSNKDADRDKLTQLCQQEAVGFHLDDQGWMSFAEFATKVPLTVSDQQEFLGKNPYFEVQDSLNRYFVSIKEYKIKESVSPLSFEVNNIRAILLNKRKSEMLTRMEEDLYKAALGKKNFEIY
ncbi:MAG: peptidyl-prolyl cis-trans isomerase [Bacteroidetes bacterium]|nr:peptidyl-prolyl cis-trans isomerase [Bacteroidota bacterium]